MNNDAKQTNSKKRLYLGVTTKHTRLMKNDYEMNFWTPERTGSYTSSG